MYSVGRRSLNSKLFAVGIKLLSVFIGDWVIGHKRKGFVLINVTVLNVYLNLKDTAGPDLTQVRRLPSHL